MVLGLGPGLGLADAIKEARGHGDTWTRVEAGLKGRPETGMNAAVHEVETALRADLGGSHASANHPVSF